jgi:hypothetical protein
VHFDTASQHANFGKSDGSLSARSSWADRSAPKAADSLTMRSMFVVVTLLSLGLWAVIWLVFVSLA